MMTASSSGVATGEGELGLAVEDTAGASEHAPRTSTVTAIAIGLIVQKTHGRSQTLTELRAQGVPDAHAELCPHIQEHQSESSDDPADHELDHERNVTQRLCRSKVKAMGEGRARKLWEDLMRLLKASAGLPVFTREDSDDLRRYIAEQEANQRERT